LCFRFFQLISYALVSDRLKVCALVSIVYLRTPAALISFSVEI